MLSQLVLIDEIAHALSEIDAPAPIGDVGVAPWSVHVNEHDDDRVHTGSNGRPQADCAREVCHASYAALRVGLVQAAERDRPALALAPAPAPASVPDVVST